MTKILVLALALALTLTLGTAAQAKRLNKPGPCPIAWEHVPHQRAAVQHLIRCAARVFHISTPKALKIAYRESNFYPRAYNSFSGASGIYQHLRRYWPGRARAYVSRWIPHASPFNARANVLVTARMVHNGGWSPWQ